MGKTSLLFSGHSMWNNLPDNIKFAKSLAKLKVIIHDWTYNVYEKCYMSEIHFNFVEYYNNSQITLPIYYRVSNWLFACCRRELVIFWSYLYHHCKLIPIYISLYVCISSIRSLYICYVASTHMFVKTFVHLLVNK